MVIRFLCYKIFWKGTNVIFRPSSFEKVLELACFHSRRLYSFSVSIRSISHRWNSNLENAIAMRFPFLMRSTIRGIYETASTREVCSRWAAIAMEINCVWSAVNPDSQNACQYIYIYIYRLVKSRPHMSAAADPLRRRPAGIKYASRA